MPIYNIAGITSTHTEDEYSVTEVGRIRKGEQVETKKKGVTRPVNLDYFRVTFREDLDELKNQFFDQVFDKPKALRVQLAYPTLKDAWWAWNSVYFKSGQLGLHDGIWWNYLRDPDTQEVLVGDYMVTASGRAKIKDGQINGHTVCSAKEALEDYLTSYHNPETELPHGWKQVELAIRRGKEPLGLLVNLQIPLYTTGSGDNYKEYFATPEGRLFLTMPNLKGFTRSMMFQFNTGSSYDIREISKNLTHIAIQSKVFDSDFGSIALDAIPMLLVRRMEVIPKPIEGKRVRLPESLVHLETVSRWQHLVDELQLRRNVQLMYSVINQELAGLTQTIDDLDLEALPEPKEAADEIMQPDPLEEVIEAEYQEVESKDETTPPEKKPEKKEEPAEKKTRARKPPANRPKLKPRDVDPETKQASLQGAIAMLDDETIQVGASQFWACVYGMGYSQKEAEPFMKTEDWRECLQLAVDHYMANANEPEPESTE